LLSPSEFRDLVSGRQRGPRATLLRGLLRVAETPYSLAMRLRNWRYDSGRAAVHFVSVPVVSVGNLTLGGTGKTPLVEWLARWFRARGVRVALVSRGYGAQAAARNDEALELEERLPDVPHLQNADRVEAAQMAVEEFDSQLILLDDAFQHRRLARQLDIVLVDAMEPFGFGHVFPRGTLREPLSGLRRAHVVALSRADMLSADERAGIQQTVRRYAPQAAWIETQHAPQRLLAAGGCEAELETLKGAKAAAFCGIGNPAGFRHTIARCGCELVELREFADHYAYGRADVESLAAWARTLAETRGIAAVLCTHKDLVKLAVNELGGVPLWAVAIGLEITAGQGALEARLLPLCTAD
jgi:tetraacyldisaccharide 4'-kinase